MNEDLKALQNFIKPFKQVIVAYSGGVDSTLVAKAANDVLGENALCVLIKSIFVPESEIIEAQTIAERLCFNFMMIEVDINSYDNILDNHPDRCYHCKKVMFSMLKKIANEKDIKTIFDGSNLDDSNDIRPGAKATEELGVLSPLKELGFTKSKIRIVAKELGLPNWNKPAYACLASRVPFNMKITPEILHQIDESESALSQLGFVQVRVRHHNEIARIEIDPIQMDKLMLPEMRQKVVEKLKNAGYTYVTMDLLGYRTGSINEALSNDKD
ncbi:MAG: ATP-dependent sacrificial sulfur transferase LarE [Armatimonadota bacterium]